MTGVQTCALPILLVLINGIQGFELIFILTQGGPGFETYVPGLWMYENAFSFQKMGYASSIGVLLFVIIFAFTLFNIRSEEPRVGKGCRSRWSPHHEKKDGRAGGAWTRERRGGRATSGGGAKGEG